MKKKMQKKITVQWKKQIKICKQVEMKLWNNTGCIVSVVFDPSIHPSIAMHSLALNAFRWRDLEIVREPEEESSNF